MNFDVPQRWIDTLSVQDWNQATLNAYWKEIFGLQDGEFLQHDSTWNYRLLLQYGIEDAELTRSLMYLTNTIVSENPAPSFWALKQLKQVFPKTFESEYSICFKSVLTQHPNLMDDFLKVGGGAEQFSDVLKTLVQNNQSNLIVDMLQYFVLDEDANKVYDKLKSVKKEFYRSMGFETANNLGNKPLKMEWFLTSHIQKIIHEVPFLDEVWQTVTSAYPHPIAIEAMKKYIASPHQSFVCNKILVNKVLNTPVEEGSSEFLQTMADNKKFFEQALNVCVKCEWLFSDNDVMKKFFSFADEQNIENTVSELSKENIAVHVLLEKANRLCEWLDSDFHPRVTQIVLSSACQKHHHLYNNLQKMTLSSELQTETKPKSRKM